MTDISKSLFSDINKALGTLTLSLRRSAMSSGWPADVASSLEVLMKEDKITIYYPPSLTDDVNTWEYGTERQRPTAVLRKFSNRIDSSMQTVLERGMY